MSKVSIVIVNWNSKDYLRKCLASVRAHAGELEPQVIVVDGGSFDGSADLIEREFPEVEFIQSPTNVGFGRANNLGVENATGEMLLLLNPDADLTAGSLQSMVRELESRPEAGMVGPRLLNSDGSLQTSVQPFPRPLRQALDSELLRSVLWPFRWWAPPTSHVPRDVMKVEATSGACMLLWTKVFRDVGGFTRDYFMYAEDVDLCWKISRKGLHIYHVPRAKVVHHGGGSSSTQGNAFSAVMMRAALESYFRINHGKMHGYAYRASIAIVSVARLCLIAVSKAFGRPASNAARAWWAVLSWSFGGQQWIRKFD